MQGTLHFFSLIRSIKIQSTKTSYKSDTDLGAGARKDIEWRGAGRDGGMQREGQAGPREGAGCRSVAAGWEGTVGDKGRHGVAVRGLVACKRMHRGAETRQKQNAGSC